MLNGLPQFEAEGASSRGEWSADGQPHLRLALLYLLGLVPLVAISARLVWLQVVIPDQFTAVFQQLREEYEEIPSRDGRILAADGSILADDEVRQELHIHYRWLQEPPDERWLRQQALARLSRMERRESERVAAEEAWILSERQRLWRQIARLTGVAPEELEQRRAQVQARIESIAGRVRDGLEARQEQRVAAADQAEGDRTAWEQIWHRLHLELTAAPDRGEDDPLVIKEELTYHVILPSITPEAAAEIEAHPERYPGSRIQVQTRRFYPRGDFAAHLIGSRTALRDDELQERRAKLGESDPLDYHVGDPIGRNGLERTYDSRLHGLRGQRRLVLNRQGEIIQSEVVRAPQSGKDLVLTLDPELQSTAERLLDAALQQETPAGTIDDETTAGAAPQSIVPTGGALVAIDVQTGAILAAAAAPRFDLNLLIRPDVERWREVRDDPRKPMFPRLTRMALPPGSVYKAVSAVALLESGKITPDTAIDCRGYLDHPGQHRCLIFRHYGVGHGETRLTDALCRSCNVYFFAGARKAGPQALVEWSQQFGIGQPTGIDLPFEESGHLPSPAMKREPGQKPWYPGDTLGLSIGQSSLMVTPLQIVRMMAAIANDGWLVTPHLGSNQGPQLVDESGSFARSVATYPEPRKIAGLHHGTLAAVREGLTLVVEDPHGTAYKTARLPGITLAGKTGTAETGGGKPDHAWFAGFAPAEQPRVAFCVVLEHGGSGSKAAAPLARELVERMRELGLIQGGALSAGRD